jgi:AraC-like DNA-binding protein
MIFFVTALGFILSALIFVNRSDKYGSNFFLALFIFLNSFYAVTSFSFISNEFRWLITKIYPFVIIPNMASGPFMYLYFLSVFKPNFKLKPIHLVHFLPVLIFFMNGFDYLFWDSTQKAKLIQTFMEDTHAVFSMPTLFFPYYYHVIFRMVQTFIYVLLCLHLFWVSFKLNEFRLTNSKIPYTYYIFFLLFFIGHYFTTLLIGIRVNPKFDNLLENSDQLAILLLSSRIFFTLFIVVTLFNPKVVFEKYFDVKKNKVIHRAKIELEFESMSADSAKYDLKEIDNLFSDYLLTNPYLQPGFSLSIISDEIKVPVHQISYYIKNRFGQTFNEWKNELRVHYAVDLINDGQADFLTLESISIQCGYLSRANFVDAFKKVLDKMPSEYLAEHRKR